MFISNQIEENIKLQKNMILYVSNAPLGLLSAHMYFIALGCNWACQLSLGDSVSRPTANAAPSTRPTLLQPPGVAAARSWRFGRGRAVLDHPLSSALSRIAQRSHAPRARLALLSRPAMASFAFERRGMQASEHVPLIATTGREQARESAVDHCSRVPLPCTYTAHDHLMIT